MCNGIEKHSIKSGAAQCKNPPEKLREFYWFFEIKFIEFFVVFREFYTTAARWVLSSHLPSLVLHKQTVNQAEYPVSLQHVDTRISWILMNWEIGSILGLIDWIWEVGEDWNFDLGEKFDGIDWIGFFNSYLGMGKLGIWLEEVGKVDEWRVTPIFHAFYWSEWTA